MSVIAVTHVYSRANAGDGLLLDLTLKRLARTGLDPDDVVVVAMDPQSLADLNRVIGLGTPTRGFDRHTAKALRNAAGVVFNPLTSRIFASSPAAVLEKANGFVAVGGGYLRAGNCVNSVGTALNHLPPLLAAARSAAPAVYLPQSVGPLRGPVGAQVKQLLARAAAVHVRDDRSAAELHSHNVQRTPDLAVLELADSLSSIPERDAARGPAVIIARALSRADSYGDRLRQLATRLGDVTWAVQAEGSDSKSDRAFYERLHLPAGGAVGEVLAGPTGPVVSVRLHGALQSLLVGVPAIHLGYERKSWGAYEDLGLARFVHDARRFDPDLVAAQVAELREDASSYWSVIRAAAPRLADISRELDVSLAATFS